MEKFPSTCGILVILDTELFNVVSGHFVLLALHSFIIFGSSFPGHSELKIYYVYQTLVDDPLVYQNSSSINISTTGTTGNSLDLKHFAAQFNAPTCSGPQSTDVSLVKPTHTHTSTPIPVTITQVPCVLSLFCRVPSR